MKTNDGPSSSSSLPPAVSPVVKTYPLPEFTQNELVAVVEAIETVFREQNFVSLDEKTAAAKVAEVLLTNNLVSAVYARYLRQTYQLQVD
jgi:hypothetical protein